MSVGIIRAENTQLCCPLWLEFYFPISDPYFEVPEPEQDFIQREREKMFIAVVKLKRGFRVV